MEAPRPRTGKQSSRKTKRAWRKNIDINDVDKGLEEARERDIHQGDEDEFYIDTAADELIDKKRAPKKLKTHEILENKSKIAPLDTKKKSNTIQGVKKGDVHRLMKVAGRVVGETSLKNRIDKEGLYKEQGKDLWDDGLEEQDQVPEILQQKSTNSVTKPKKAPSIHQQGPTKLFGKKERQIEAGKSYNPTLESWKQLINNEYMEERERERIRQQLAEYREKTQFLASRLETEEDSGSSEEEQEKSDSEEVDQENGDYSLSVNKPTKVKIKTKTKRNKERRGKKKEELEKNLKEMKERLKELSRLDSYLEEIESKKQQPGLPKEKKVKKFSKYDTMPRPLEVKLSDELTSNLKDLKPEGNLLYDTMVNYQEKGIIESRIPVAKKRKYTPKVSEKWSYKDFK